MFSPYLQLWKLRVDGSPIVTNSGQLLPVQWHGQPAILKIAVAEEEKLAAGLMTWWNGEGAARVLAHDGDALLLERARGSISLAELAHTGHDDEAIRIICSVVSRLHAHADNPPPGLSWLSNRFQSLNAAAQVHGGVFADSVVIARELLANPRDVRVLHGDIHHFNILDFGERGWLAIDPKGLIGERGFDYANLFCNPDLETAVAPERFICRVKLVADVAHLDRERLLKWILAWAGLSAAWHLEDGTSPVTALTIAGMALTELNS
jgi:streptomycin 6-kinase